MSDPGEKSPSFLIKTVAISISLLAIYVGSYFALTTKYQPPISSINFYYRYCDYKWMEAAYRPLARIEGTVKNQEIMLYHLRWVK
jgi:hypothetical protein